MLTPFDYQLNAIEELRHHYSQGRRQVLLCMLMGAGKTCVALKLMHGCQDKGNRALFLCDRRMLASQTLERAREEGLDAGLIMSGYGGRPEASCQFASKQTVESWLKSDYNPGDFNLIVVDEAHRAVSDRWTKLLGRWPNAFIVGLTATPCLGNGNGMGAYYEALVQPIQPSKLREMGRIVPVRAFVPHVPNLKGVKRDGDGDYSARDLSRRLTRDNLVADVAGWWKRLGEGRPSIYFACDIAHATAICEEFNQAGVPAEMISDETPDTERDAIRTRLSSEVTKVVVNCDVLAEGIDWPFVQLIGLVRPTKRLRRYLQNSGRGMRSCMDTGKQNCILIDHAGCVPYHGFPDIDRDWPLSEEDNVDERQKEKRKKELAPTICAQCKAVFSGTNVCPECGHVHKLIRQPKHYEKKHGTLVEIERSGGFSPPEMREIHQRYWSMCIGTAIKRGRHAGVAAGMFSQKFGIPPWEARVTPLVSSTGWKMPAAEVFPGYARRR